MLRKLLRPDAWRSPGSNPQERITEPSMADAEELAASIRELAVDARHALNDPLVTAANLNDLSRRIGQLRKSARSARLSEIDGWLHQVQRQVEERRQAARLATRA